MLANIGRLWSLAKAVACPRCGLHCATGFCSFCRRDFERVPAPCLRCAMPTPCVHCPADNPGWLLRRTLAPFAYAEPLAHYLRALKYQRQRQLGRALGGLLAGVVADAAADVDVIVSVPLHPRRLRVRSFNQADEIARVLAATLHLPLLSRGIKRQLDTAPQTELDRETRLRNPHNAFLVTRRMNGLRVAIVDDIMTTGGTANALARACRNAGAAEIEAWTVARSVGNKTVEGLAGAKDVVQQDPGEDGTAKPSIVPKCDQTIFAVTLAQ